MHELGRGQFGQVWLAHRKGIEAVGKELHWDNSLQARQETLLQST